MQYLIMVSHSTQTMDHFQEEFGGFLSYFKGSKNLIVWTYSVIWPMGKKTATGSLIYQYRCSCVASWIPMWNSLFLYIILVSWAAMDLRQECCTECLIGTGKLQKIHSFLLKGYQCQYTSVKYVEQLWDITFFLLQQ